ncbi:MAG: hypothetical protein MUC33_01415 [Desulfobacterales bacterium]|nr:hypothetical protein [Desulfobacterales bacterium]MCU0601302.1 hypothetical protein [Desulfobacterales bacterium]
MTEQLSISQAPSEKPEALKSILEVVRYLEGLDKYRVKQATVYRHRDQGKLRPQSDGTFLVKDVERYAGTFLKLKDGSGGLKMRPASPAVADDKAAAEARKVSAQAEHWEIKTRILKGEYVERSAFEAALARRAAVFKSDIENFIRSSSAEMIKLVSGDDLKAPDVIEYMLEASERWLARYSEDAHHELPESIDAGRLEKIEA